MVKHNKSFISFSSGVAHGTVGTVPTVPIFTAGTENRTKKVSKHKFFF